MGQCRVGFDFDGVIHASCRNSHAAFCKTLQEHGLPVVPLELMRGHFTSDWHTFFEQMGIPPELRPLWKDEYQARYDGFPNGDLVPGSREMVLDVSRRADGQVYVVTNELLSRVNQFLGSHRMSFLHGRAHYARDGKAALLDSLELTDYIGDTVSDGIACMRARGKPRFIGVAHDFGYNTPDLLYALQKQHPDHRIEIVSSIDDVARFF